MGRTTREVAFRGKSIEDRDTAARMLAFKLAMGLLLGFGVLQRDHRCLGTGPSWGLFGRICVHFCISF
jgi:hypothetical protein